MQLCFYRGALNGRRSSQEKAVCLSIHLSVKRVDCDKTEEKICPEIPKENERSFSVVF